ncbi:helix-turn-helix domain-containing protein [Nesterenkonia muleiensis]|uniref:helix-turn-helix domain-containing protein n=1 Tax=Nesterenkonia muleiensis TaxID=2282648 RepID=UPI000E74A33F|nr:helix-turn-helix domain-containing protein [Nesterenkonia muleiensis]
MGQEPGNYSLEDVTWRAVVDPADPLMPHLARIFLEPLMDRVSDPQILLHTVQAYLEADRSYNQAAKHLHCHANTVRYRIGRFQELTGVDVDSTEVMTSLMWFLEARARTS